MYCSSCGQLNEGNKFCVKCGVPLIAVETQSEPDLKPSKPLAENEHVKKAMDTSQQFFRYSLEVLKGPLRVSAQVEQTGLINGIIAQALFVFILPLITFIILASNAFLSPSFFKTVIQPWALLIVFVVVVNLAVFLSVKLGKANVSIKDVVARLGSFMIVPVAILVVALLLSIIQLSGLALLLLNLSLLGTLAGVVLTIYTFISQSEQSGQGLDALYGILVSFIIMGIMASVMGRILVSSMISSFNPFF